VEKGERKREKGKGRKKKEGSNGLMEE